MPALPPEEQHDEYLPEYPHEGKFTASCQLIDHRAHWAASYLSLFRALNVFGTRRLRKAAALLGNFQDLFSGRARTDWFRRPKRKMGSQGGAVLSRKRVLEIAPTVGVAALLLLAARGRYPYGFYMMLRTVATVAGAYWAVRVYHAGPRGWMWAFLALALLLNPILPVRMRRVDWQPIDLCIGILLLGWAGYWAFRKPSVQ